MSKIIKSLDLHRQIHTPLIEKTIEIQERLQKISPLISKAAEIQQQFAILHSLSSPIIVKSLRNTASISQLFKNRGILERYTSAQYNKTLKSILASYAEEFNLSDATELILNDYELYPDQLILPERKIYLLNEVPKVQKLISGIFNDNSRIFGLESWELEEVTAELLSKQNWKVRLTKRTRDGGYDIIAIQHMGDIPINMLVECKRGKNKKIGVEMIRSFSHVITHSDSNLGMFLTTSYFSSEAKAERDRTMGNKLIFRDYDDIIAWINNQPY